MANNCKYCDDCRCHEEFYCPSCGPGTSAERNDVCGDTATCGACWSRFEIDPCPLCEPCTGDGSCMPAREVEEAIRLAIDQDPTLKSLVAKLEDVESELSDLQRKVYLARRVVCERREELRARMLPSKQVYPAVEDCNSFDELFGSDDDVAPSLP